VAKLLLLSGASVRYGSKLRKAAVIDETDGHHPPLHRPCTAYYAAASIKFAPLKKIEGRRRTGPASKMLESGVTNSYTSWQKFVATDYFLLIP